MNPPDTRSRLVAVLQAALAAVQGRSCVRDYLSHQRPMAPVRLVAVGKAAASQALGALDVWGDAVVAGLVITKDGHGSTELQRWPQVRCLTSSHPVPDARSLAVGCELLEFVAAIGRDEQALFLISGGASALVEALVEGVTLDDLVCLNQWLLASGWDIARVNAVRRRVSRIKGGGLACQVRAHAALALLISDVQGDDPRVIGSGLVATRGAGHDDLPDVPPWISSLLARAAPVTVDGCDAAIPQVIVASLNQAKQAAADHGRALGYSVYLHPEFVGDDAAEQGARLGRTLLEGAPGLHIWGGETTVQLPVNPGMGGRNQTLALAAAQVLAGSSAWLLAAGTDGTAGPGTAAGALIDGETLARGVAVGLDAQGCIARADAGRFLMATGDLLYIGPSGTNVMDLILGLTPQAGKPR